MVHNIKIVKGLHKECVYCRKNGIRKITNSKYNECDISMCPEYLTIKFMFIKK